MTILLDKSRLDTIKGAIDARLPVMLIGETGVGKTTIVSQIAKELGYSLTRLSLNDQVGREDLIGRYGLDKGSTKWQDGPLLDAMKTGKWIVLDELNSARPEVLFALHAILDDERAIVVQEKDNERIIAHANFRLFGTINPVTYHGTKSLNQAFMSRFVVIGVDVLPANDEIKLVADKTGLTTEKASEIVALGGKLRNLYFDGQVEYFCSTRDLIMAASLIAKGVDFAVAVSCALFNKITSEDMQFLTDNVGDVNKLVKAAATDGKKLRDELASFEAMKVDKVNLETHVKKLKADVDLVRGQVSDLLNQRDKAEVEISRMASRKANLEIEVKTLATLSTKEKAKIAKEYLKDNFIGLPDQE